MMKSGGSRVSSHRSTLSLQKVEVIVNIYDLLPPGRLSSALWMVGSSPLHSGVVIKDKEYAYGGHDRRGVSGVYWTRPRLEPPGATFRCDILHGFTLQSQKEIENIIQEVSNEFLGPSYNLLNRNCNHFTDALCERLTSRRAPGWLNRAASIGFALPCVVPRDWIAPPDHDTAEGALLEDYDKYERDDGSAIALSLNDTSGIVTVAKIQNHLPMNEELDDGLEDHPESDEHNAAMEGRSGTTDRGNSKGKRIWSGKYPIRDSNGRMIPPSERAPPFGDS